MARLDHTRLLNPTYFFLIFAILGSSFLFTISYWQDAYADTNSASAAYRSNNGTNTINSPKYREWNAGTESWSSQVELPSGGSEIINVRLEYSPINTRRFVLTQDVNGVLDLFRCNSSCTTPSNWQLVASDLADTFGATPPARPHRTFDMEFEKTSGDLVIVYDRDVADANEIGIRVWSESTQTLGSETVFDLHTASTNPTIAHIACEASPLSGSDQITCTFLDRTNNRSDAAVWNGSTFPSGDKTTLSTGVEATSTASESVWVEYESNSGDALAFSGNGANSAAFREWDSLTSTWSGISTTDPNGASPQNDVEFVRIFANPNSASDELMVCQKDDVPTSDITCSEWSGAAFGTWNQITGATDEAVLARSFDFQWNPGTGGTGVIVFSADSLTTISRNTWSGTAWGTASTTPYTGDQHWIRGARNPTAADNTDSLWMVLNANADIGGLKWNGTTLTNLGEGKFSSDTIILTMEILDVKFQRSTASVPAFTRTLVETLAATDALVQAGSKFLTDTETLGDIIVQSGSKFFADSITVADTFAKGKGTFLLDSMTLGDTMVQSASRFITDAVTMADTIVKARAMFLTDSITLTDTIAATTQIVKNLTDSLALADTTVRASSRRFDDSLSLSDTIVTQSSKFITDSVTLTDTVVATKQFPQVLTDNIALVDTVVTTSSAGRVLTDSITLTDAVSTGGAIFRTLTESLSLTDTINTFLAGLGLLTESLSLSDTIGLTHIISMPVGTSVSANLLGGQGVVGGVTLTFPSVSTLGSTTVTQTTTGPTASGFDIQPGGQPIYFNIETTAGFTPPVMVCIGYDEASLTVPETELTLRRFNGISWEVLTDIQVNTNNNTICGDTNSFSPFAVTSGGGGIGIGGGGGGGPQYVIVDTVPPEIVSHSYHASVPVAGKELTVTANIIDDVGVSKAYLLYFVTAKELEFHQVAMENRNNGWFTGTIPASDVRTVGLLYWIFAQDFGGNNIQSSVQRVDVQQAPSVPEAKATVTSLPAHVLEAINSKPKPTQPVERLEVISMNGGNEIKAYPDKIIIKNTGNYTADNIRIMLSPEIAKSFRLSYPAIKSIEPNGNVTVTLELNGSPNRDMAGGLVGYKGKLLVMAEHLSPIILPVNIGAQESYYLTNYMDKVASMAEQRYNKISLLNSILSKQPKTQQNYEVTTSDGDKVITSPSDELVIRNLSDKELKNVRIYLSNVGNVFLLEQRNIQYLEPNGEVSIKLIPKIDTKKYSPKDIKGELLIVPSNDKPIKIPIDIIGAERKDSADEFEVRTLLGNDGIFTAEDKIIIKNLGNRTLDSVRLILSGDLARVFMLSSDSFKRIEANGEVVVDLKFREDLGVHKMGLQYNYQGELTVVSEHHRQKVIPINIVWNEVSSDHFEIYSRNSEADIAKAKDVVAFLESNYQNVTSRFGEMKTKTTIYMTNTLEEFRAIAESGHSYYAFSDDVIFICGCAEDVKSLAMKEFVYRITFNKYPNYTNKEKFIFDGENWLMDGIANYVTANMTGEQGIVKSQIESFKEKPTSFVWYGSGSPEQYGAAYTFFEYLHEKYGDKVIDKTLHYLGSGMISNTRCDTLEDCAVLRAVYDVSGLDMKKKRYGLDVETLVNDWEDYVMEHYGVAIPKQDQE